MSNSYLHDLLARLAHFSTPDGLDVEPQNIAPAYIRFSGKLSLSQRKMAEGRYRYEEIRATDRSDG